jgi:hypothetical protein
VECEAGDCRRAVSTITKVRTAFAFGEKKLFFGLFDPEGQGSRVLQNVGNCLPNSTMSHPRRLESPANTAVRTANIATLTCTSQKHFPVYPHTSLQRVVSLKARGILSLPPPCPSFPLAQTFHQPTLPRFIIIPTYLPRKMEPTQSSETSAHKTQMPGKYPEESTIHRFKDFATIL